MRRLLHTLLALAILLTQYGLTEHIYDEHFDTHAHYTHDFKHHHDHGDEQDSDEICFLCLASHQYKHAIIPSLSLSFVATDFELQSTSLQTAISQAVIPSYAARAPPRFL